MKKIIGYALIWFVTFLVMLAFGVLISGESDIMKWSESSRFVALFLSIIPIFLHVVYKEYKD